ncbi:Hypothetical_protein [Hexamita inflata]|uniref:Hypothetical_protein n=1 Tax=Hexamita inflata TaxID=28002 RepID=A0AA86PZK6_9EUKA|nr:Hypothetical protein HINF_LOCUS34677 [Hexamita inflata]
MAPKSKQVLLYVQQSVIAYQLNIADMKYQQALHDVEIQLILYYYTKSILQQGKVDIFSPTLINIWSEKLQIKIKSVYVKAQKSQLQLGSFQERLLKNRGAHTVPYLVKQWKQDLRIQDSQNILLGKSRNRCCLNQLRQVWLDMILITLLTSL